MGDDWNLPSRNLWLCGLFYDTWIPDIIDLFFQREERKSKSMKKPIGSKELIAELAKNDKKNKKKPKEEDQVEWD